MEKVLYKAATRGHKHHGWLEAHHTFSFGDYFDLDRINFGALRVLNDDIIQGGKGFGKHPHDNMEIITIPLSGDLEHSDSMGHTSLITSGEIQVMSAGSGLYHSEYNANANTPLNLFQIWIHPRENNVKPRYDQKKFDFSAHKNVLLEVISPNQSDDTLWVHQDTWFNLGTFDNGFKTDYQINKKGNGVFAMVIEGEFTMGDQRLSRRDALGVWDTDRIQLQSLSDNARILLIEVPMLF
ncbi:MAG: hypothetical protein RL662_881 [Bacteroidota bacterium]|jgi:redox-sensitive bicupin YhaK (pirin superfamily)